MAPAALFRGLALLGSRLYVTDFHNARVVVLDSKWQQVRLRAARSPTRRSRRGTRRSASQAIGRHIFVTYAWRAPVNGNDAPTGGYVDEFTPTGRLVARLPRARLNEPWGLTLAPKGFGAVRRRPARRRTSATGRSAPTGDAAAGWVFDGSCTGRDHKPLVVSGLWALAFGNDGLAGS